MEPRALILAGRGRYEDPWHDHAATSHLVAHALSDMRVAPTVRGLFHDALRDVSAYDLVVVNAGSGRVDPDFDGDDAAWAPTHDALRDHVSAGGAVLGLHQTANTFTDSPHWTALLGGRWIPGHSMHPPQAEATFTPCGDHPIVAGLGPIVVDDEQYCHLVVEPGSQAFLTTHHDGRDHPVAWASRAGRVVYDGSCTTDWVTTSGPMPPPRG